MLPTREINTIQVHAVTWAKVHCLFPWLMYAADMGLVPIVIPRFAGFLPQWMNLLVQKISQALRLRVQVLRQRQYNAQESPKQAGNANAGPKTPVDVAFSINNNQPVKMHTNIVHKRELTLFDLIILVLSIYVLVAFIVDVFIPVSPGVSDILNILDNIVCMVFLYDFIKDFYKAKNKWEFMKWGWIDLLSSIPYLDFFRAGRLFRIFRLVRLIRAFRSSKLLLDFVFEKRTKGAFTTAAIIAILMLLFSSIAIISVENVPESNIKTAEDALWWAFVTLTTTGYGDRYPVTTEGRMIAAVLMVTGVGLFGTFTGYIASWFVQDSHQDHT